MQGNIYEEQRKRGIKRKLEAILKLGGGCSKCGYDGNLSALEFHHIRPEEKSFVLEKRNNIRNGVPLLLQQYPITCRNSIVVSTVDFHSTDGGSNPPSDTMTREEKNKKKKALGILRKEKKRAKDKLYMKVALENGRNSVSWGRQKLQGRVWTCEMYCQDCESRGYCNGDC